MNIRDIIEFIQKETPENKDLVLAAFKSMEYMLREEQKLIDYGIPKLLADRDYDRVNKYVEMSKKVSEIYLNITKWAEECGLGINDTSEGDTIETDKIENNSSKNQIDPSFANDKRINYEDYRVDENIAYGLMTDFRHMKPAAFSLEGIRYPARLWKLILLKTCELLWRKNQTIFEDFTNDRFMQGKSRDYFSIDNSGMTKPELLEGTNIFVETNLSANSIRDVIVKMLDKYSIPHSDYKIYLSKDLTSLHCEENRSITSKTEDNICEEMEEEIQLPQESEILNMQEHCVDYDYKTEKCLNENSPYFIMKCCKQKSCSWIKKRVTNGGKNIYVFPKSILKKRVCPKCESSIERTLLPITFIDSQKIQQKKLVVYQCQKCEKTYVTEGIYQTFVRNKKLEDIEATFIILDDNKQESLF